MRLASLVRCGIVASAAMLATVAPASGGLSDSVTTVFAQQGASNERDSRVSRGTVRGTGKLIKWAIIGGIAVIVGVGGFIKKKMTSEDE